MITYRMTSFLSSELCGLCAFAGDFRDLLETFVNFVFFVVKQNLLVI